MHHMLNTYVKLFKLTNSFEHMLDCLNLNFLSGVNYTRLCIYTYDDLVNKITKSITVI